MSGGPLWGSTARTVLVRIRLRLIDNHSMIEVRQARLAMSATKLATTRELRIVDVLRLIRQLVIVAVPGGREERDRNAIARVLVVIAPAIDPLRVAVRVEG